jgi:hypothetical protein
VRDPLGIVPPDIRERYERAEFVDRAAKAGKLLEAHLKATMDPALEVVFVRHDIDPEYLPPSAVAGRWHVRRKNPMPALPTYMPILAPDGGYRDPDSGVPAELAERDLTRPGAVERAIERGRVDNQRGSRAKALETEQRRDEVLSDFQTARRMTEGAIKDSYASRGKHKRKVKA